MAEREDTVQALYYRVVKMYELPVRNHTHVRTKIRELVREIGEFRAKHYLNTLMKRNIRTEPFDFKPSLQEALDPYIKRVKIEEYFIRNKVNTNKPPALTHAQREAERQKQWED